MELRLRIRRVVVEFWRLKFGTQDSAKFNCQFQLALVRRVGL